MGEQLYSAFTQVSSQKSESPIGNMQHVDFAQNREGMENDSILDE